MLLCLLYVKRMLCYMFEKIDVFILFNIYCYIISTHGIERQIYYNKVEIIHIPISLPTPCAIEPPNNKTKKLKMAIAHGKTSDWPGPPGSDQSSMGRYESAVSLHGQQRLIRWSMPRLIQAFLAHMLFP